jgi:Protein of unknown function (DUF2752)
MHDERYIGPEQHCLLLACILVSMIVFAWAPDAVLGLHYQCLLSSATGIRCPFCGMTRDFILMSKGFPPSNNPASLFAALATYVGYPIWIVVTALRRRSSPLVSRSKVLKTLIAVMMVLFVWNNLVR